MGRIGRGQSFEGDAIAQVHKTCHELLEDLVSKKAAEVYLRCGARAVRVLQLLNLADSSLDDYIAIISGDNKHKKDFFKEIEKELA